jgi:hypothetical protein
LVRRRARTFLFQLRETLTQTFVLFAETFDICLEFAAVALLAITPYGEVMSTGRGREVGMLGFATALSRAQRQ